MNIFQFTDGSIAECQNNVKYLLNFLLIVVV